jgi:protease stability complex PrcB-like protein
MMLLALTLVVGLVQPPGAARPNIPMMTEMPTMKTIDKGDHSNMDDAKQIAVKTEAAWKQLWQQHSPDRPRPAVDFTKEMVVGVFLGSRPTAGYKIEIVSATETNGTLVVRYREAPPPRGMMTAQVVTSPYHLVTVPFFPGDVKFERVQP